MTKHHRNLRQSADRFANVPWSTLRQQLRYAGQWLFRRRTNASALRPRASMAVVEVSGTGREGCKVRNAMSPRAVELPCPPGIA